MAAKPVCAYGRNKKVKDEDHTYRQEKRQNEENEMGRIKGRRLEVRQQRKPHSHVAIPKRQVSGSVAFKQAMPHRIEVGAEIAEERDLRAENNVLAKPEKQQEDDHQSESVRRVRKLRLVFTHEAAWLTLLSRAKVGALSNNNTKEDQIRSQRRGGHLDPPLLRNRTRTLWSFYYGHPLAGPAIAPVALAKVQFTPVQRSCVAVKRNVLLAPTVPTVVTCALLLNPAGEPLANVPPL
jgi:hypothetical protein